MTRSFALWLRLLLLRHPSKETLQRFCDVELEPRHRRRVQRHLCRCAACSAEVAARRALMSTLDIPRPAAAEVAELRTRLFNAIAAVPAGVVQQDVEYLLGRRAASHPCAPGERLAPALERELEAFLGLRTAARLQSHWHAPAR